jgi:GTPase-activating protein BEM2
MEREVAPLQFDLRGIKEEAQREASMGMPSPAKKLPKPFSKLVSVQIEKNRRDRALRTRMQKEKLQEQTKNEKRDELLTRAMRPKKLPTTAAQKQHRQKKSMSAFFSFMRPISSAFTSETAFPPGLKRSESELDFMPSGKPTSVVLLTEAKVARFINNERSFTFQLETEDGAHYVLQATSRKEVDKWLEIIAKVTNIAAQRRLTYISNSPKPQLADHIHSHPIQPSRDPSAVFGVNIATLLEREVGDLVPPGTVPSFIETCLTEIEARGLTEVGICECHVIILHVHLY